MACFAHEVGYGIARTFWKIGDCCTCCDQCGNGAHKTVVPVNFNISPCCVYPHPEPGECKPRCQKGCKATCSSGCEHSTIAAPAASAATTVKSTPAVAVRQSIAGTSPTRNPAKAQPVRRSVFAPAANYANANLPTSATNGNWTVAKPVEPGAKPEADRKSPSAAAPIVRTGHDGAPAQLATRIPSTASSNSAVAAVANGRVVSSAAGAGPANAFASHAPDYSWIHGKLDRLEGMGGAWVLRYAAPAEKDALGGVVVLAFDRRLRSFKPGEIVLIKGQLAGNAPLTQIGGPLYRIASIERTGN